MNSIFDRFITSITKETTKSILALILYITFIITLIESNPPVILQLVIFITQICISTIFCSVYLTLWLNDMSSRVIDLSETILKELKKIAKEIGLFFVVLVISDILFSLFIVGQPENQTQVIAEFNQAPIINSITLVLIGPMLEEFVFRYLPYQFIKGKARYIFVSAFIFAIMHVVDDPNAFYYIWVYMINSVYYGYRYYKTKDLFVTISLHSFNNLLSLLPLIIARF